MSSINQTSAHRRAQEWEPAPKQEAPRPLSAVEYCVVSLAAKGIAVFGYHPLLMRKFDEQTSGAGSSAMQAAHQTSQDSKIRLRNPWHGVAVNLWNAPLYAVMGTVNGVLHNLLAGQEQRPLQDREKHVLSLLSAACGAVPASMLDLIMIQKKELSKQAGRNVNAWQTVHLIVENRGFYGLCRGMVPALMREVPYGWTMIQGGPIVTQWFQDRLPDNLGPTKKPVAALLSSLTIGPLCAVATQFSDVLKSVVQSRCLTHKRAELYKTGREILAAGAREALTGHWTHKWLPRNTPEGVVAMVGALRAGHVGLGLRTQCFVVATAVIIITTPVLEAMARSWR